MLIVDERISIPRCTLTAPKSCEKAIGNVDTRPLPPVFPHCTLQWGLSTNDPGMGGATFSYPVTCNPFIALAGTTKLGTAGMPTNDAVVTEIGTTSCTIDSTPAEYTGTYRVVVIGKAV